MITIYSYTVIFSRKMNMYMTPGRKVRRYTKNEKKKCDFFVQLPFSISGFQI
eukprot:UN14007